MSFLQGFGFIGFRVYRVLGLRFIGFGVYRAYGVYGV